MIANTFETGKNNAAQFKRTVIICFLNTFTNKYEYLLSGGEK